jgi:hypothetical protein
MAKSTLSFTCSTSHDALLLLAFYDVISNVAPEDSIAATDNIAWLIDEIGGHAAAMAEYLELEGRGVPWQLRGLAKMYEHLPRMGKTP